jgi:hypothetical protein
LTLPDYLQKNYINFPDNILPKYKNKRADFADTLFQHINWDNTADRLNIATKGVSAPFFLSAADTL